MVQVVYDDMGKKCLYFRKLVWFIDEFIARDFV